MDASEISKLARALQTAPKYISLKLGLRLPPLTPPQSLSLSRHTRWSSSDVIQSFQPVRQLVVRREISTIVICWLHRSSCRISQSDCLTLLIPPTSAWVYLHTTVALSWRRANVLELETDKRINTGMIIMRAVRKHYRPNGFYHHGGATEASTDTVIILSFSQHSNSF